MFVALASGYHREKHGDAVFGRSNTFGGEGCSLG